MTEGIVITNIGPTEVEADFIETEESKATRQQQVERNAALSPVKGKATLTLTFATATDRDYWVEQNAGVLNLSED